MAVLLVDSLLVGTLAAPSSATPPPPPPPPPRRRVRAPRRSQRRLAGRRCSAAGRARRPAWARGSVRAAVRVGVRAGTHRHAPHHQPPPPRPHHDHPPTPPHPHPPPHTRLRCRAHSRSRPPRGERATGAARAARATGGGWSAHDLWRQGGSWGEALTTPARHEPVLLSSRCRTVRRGWSFIFHASCCRNGNWEV